MSTTSSDGAAFRIGAVSFLNTVPLIHGLEDRDDVSLLRDLPSRLADRLYEEHIEVGLIPIVEYLRGVGSDIVPGICLGSDGPVHSVKVFSRCPLEQADSIAVDRGSRSSVALLRILLAEMYGRHPDLFTAEPRPEAPFRDHNTALVIGDRAMDVRPDGLHVYDLGELWRELTGLPFVFAAWVLSNRMAEEDSAGRREALIRCLSEARDRGRESLHELANSEARARGREADDILLYWTRSIRYEMGEAELGGLERFAELAAKHNLCAGRTKLRLASA
jgi:chorismate dehydratase